MVIGCIGEIKSNLRQVNHDMKRLWLKTDRLLDNGKPTEGVKGDCSCEILYASRLNILRTGNR